MRERLYLPPPPFGVWVTPLSPAREMIWSPSPKKEAPSPDVQLPALEMDISLVDSSKVARKLFGANEPSSDLSNTPQGALAVEEPPKANTGGKDGVLSGLEHGKSVHCSFPVGAGVKMPAC